MSSESPNDVGSTNASVADAVNGFVSAMIERMSVLKTELSTTAAAQVENAVAGAKQRAESESHQILDGAHAEAAHLKSVAEDVLKAAHSEADSVKSHISAEKDKLLADTRAECDKLTAEAAAEAKRVNDQTLLSVDRILEEARQSAEETRSQAIAERESLLAEAQDAEARSESTLDAVRAEAAEIIRKAHLESGSIKATAHTEAAELRAQADFALRTAQAEAEHVKHQSAKAHPADAKQAHNSDESVAEAKRKHDNILETAKTEADKIKAAAQAESESILVHAKSQAEKLVSDAQTTQTDNPSSQTRSDSMDLKHAAGLLEIDEDSVREAIKEGSLNAVTVDGETRLLYTEVISLLKQAVTHTRQQVNANQSDAEMMERLQAENATLQQQISNMQKRGDSPANQGDDSDRNGKPRPRQSTIVEIVQGVEKRPLAEQVTPSAQRAQPAQKQFPVDPRFTVVDVPQKPKNVLSKIALAIWGEP